LVSLIGLALAAGVSWIVAGQILVPVQLLHRAAVQIGEDDLIRRIPVRGNDDIAALVEQFKVRALGERHWQLEAIGEGTVRVDPQRITQAMCSSRTTPSNTPSPEM
jgi:HAMP domain-containing protein